MKFIVVVAFFLAVVTVGQSLEIPAEIKAEILKIKKECIDETHVDLEVLKEAKKGVFAENDDLKKFFKCFFEKAEFINDKGEFQKNIIKEKITKKFDEATAQKIVDACIKKEEGNATETAFQLAKCYHEHAPQVNLD